MRIAVMGAGGVGGYFGARLAQAGSDVAFIARGAHLDAIRAAGLHVKSALGDMHLARPTVTDDPSTLPPVDVVIFAVKLWDTEAAARQVAPLVRDGGVIVPFQNGIDSIERVGAVVGGERVMGGAAYIAATMSAPGAISHTGTMARLRFGTVVPAQQPLAQAFLAACLGAGIEAELVDDIHRVLWEKFIFLVALSGLTAAARAPIGVVRADAEMRAVFQAAMTEAWRVARARGIDIGEDFVAQQMRFGDGLPESMKASMLHDLEAGRRLEAPWLSGAVSDMSRAAGLSAPVNATLYAVVRPFCSGRA